MAARSGIPFWLTKLIAQSRLGTPCLPEAIGAPGAWSLGGVMASDGSESITSASIESCAVSDAASAAHRTTGRHTQP